MPDGEPHDQAGRFVVVLDVNIYLDVADELGEPFTWEKFEAALSGAPCHSLRAIAMLRTGAFPDGRKVEVWTSEHIDRLVALKASTISGR